jgi:hypothetical protein
MANIRRVFYKIIFIVLSILILINLLHVFFILDLKQFITQISYIEIFIAETYYPGYQVAKITNYDRKKY